MLGPCLHHSVSPHQDTSTSILQEIHFPILGEVKELLEKMVLLASKSCSVPAIDVT